MPTRFVCRRPWSLADYRLPRWRRVLARMRSVALTYRQIHGTRLPGQARREFLEALWLADWTTVRDLSDVHLRTRGT